MNDGIVGFGGQTRDEMGQRRERAGQGRTGQSNRAEHKR